MIVRDAQMFECNEDHDEQSHDRLQWWLWSTIACSIICDEPFLDCNENCNDRLYAQSQKRTRAMIMSKETCMIASIDRWESIEMMFARANNHNDKSKEAHTIEAIDWWYQLQWCSWEGIIKTLNGDKDCQGERKRENINNNQLAVDCYCFFVLYLSASEPALTIHKRVCWV